MTKRHSWAQLTENLAGNNRLLKFSSAIWKNAKVKSAKKKCFQSAKSAKIAKLLKSTHLLHKIAKSAKSFYCILNLLNLHVNDK